MTVPDGAISCAEHGTTPYALICVHLREPATVLEYFANARCEHGPAQAWCAECDRFLTEQRGWTDDAVAQADFKLYCTECYKEALRRHRFVSYVQGSDEPCDWSEVGPPDV